MFYPSTVSSKTNANLGSDAGVTTADAGQDGGRLTDDHDDLLSGGCYSDDGDGVESQVDENGSSYSGEPEESGQGIHAYWFHSINPDVSL